jgi:hypothetical protein
LWPLSREDGIGDAVMAISSMPRMGFIVIFLQLSLTWQEAPLRFHMTAWSNPFFLLLLK